MGVTFLAAIEVTLSLYKEKRFLSAIQAFRLMVHAQNPQVHVVANYQLGVVYWNGVGDGEAARMQFIKTAEICEGDAALQQKQATRQLWANSCENLMLLSRSPEEYEQWAAQLQKLQPDNLILHDQRPKFRKALDEGHPWGDMMQIMASGYYNRNDPKRDLGQYGSAASIWQLVLKNRKGLHLSRDDWRRGVVEHAVLTMRMAQHAGQEMERATGRPAKMEEFLFVNEATIPFIEEFLASNPSDPMILDLQKKVQHFLATMRGTATSGPPTAPPKDSSRRRTVTGPPIGLLCAGILIVCTALSWIAGMIWHFQYAWQGGLGIGVGLSVLISIPLHSIRERTSRCWQCQRPVTFARGNSDFDASGSQCKTCLRVVCSDCDVPPTCYCNSSGYMRIRLIYPDASTTI